MVTSTEGLLRLRVERRGGRSILAESSGHVPLAARTVGDGKVVLVQTAAGPLAGDQIAVDVEVGPGATLELTSTAATLAYPASEHGSVSLRFHVGRGGRLAWLAQPLILAAGCDLAGSVDLNLEEDAVAVVRETVVLGRHGETAGSYRGDLRCELDGRPLLRERAVLDGASATTASALVLGGATAYATLAVLGARPDAEPSDDELELAGPGRLLRALAPDAVALRMRLDRAEPDYLSCLCPS